MYAPEFTCREDGWKVWPWEGVTPLLYHSFIIPLPIFTEYKGLSRFKCGWFSPCHKHDFLSCSGRFNQCKNSLDWNSCRILWLQRTCVCVSSIPGNISNTHLREEMTPFMSQWRSEAEPEDVRGRALITAALCIYAQARAPKWRTVCVTRVRRVRRDVSASRSGYGENVTAIKVKLNSRCLDSLCLQGSDLLLLSIIKHAERMPAPGLKYLAD